MRLGQVGNAGLKSYRLRKYAEAACAGTLMVGEAPARHPEIAAAMVSRQEIRDRQE